MNFNKFINSDYLKSNPLCGIGTYKDELNLATGACTRQIKKLVFDGTEAWYSSSQASAFYTTAISTSCNKTVTYNSGFLCNAYNLRKQSMVVNLQDGECTADGSGNIYFRNYGYSTLQEFETYLQQQYANGTPVTVWYILATPTTETITVPSGLSGTEEGYLNQSGTPTPTNPIYPTANTVEKWFDLNHYIMGTATDTITTLPADLYADGNNATVGLVGNMSQTGTPSPQSPIQPQETGERTANLYNTTATDWTLGILDDNGQPTGSTSSHYTTNYTEVSPETAYFLSGTISTTGSLRIYFYSSDKSWISRTAQKTTGDFTTPQNCFYIRIQVTVTIEDTSDWMLNLGSTALPYEPYGVKIPISSANTTTTVYLGGVQSTRKIYKLVLTGDEDWSATAMGVNDYIFRFTPTSLPLTGIAPICTHYIGSTATTWVGLDDYCITTSILQAIAIRAKNNYSSVSDFTNYLQQQYAAGTPVCVWYVLATETTGIVNEPLRKIGDYADEVSGITIPTIAGANTISVDTTLQPSEVTVNYKGWHPVADVHERDNGQWD